MKNQSADLPRGYLRLVRRLRNQRWLLATPLARLQRYWFPAHDILPPGAFFDALVRRQLGRGPERPFEAYQAELQRHGGLRDHLADLRVAGRNTPDHADAVRRRCGNVSVFYALVRELRPGVVVETGTASGHMTSWLLAALDANAHGRLVSIDLAPVNGARTMEMTLGDDEVGYLVPPALRARWTLVRGDAKACLHRVLLEHPADLFVHDSLHTRTHMQFELNVARALMRPGACIACDDILWNDAFYAFVSAHRLRSLSCVTNPNLGVTRNDFDDYELGIGVGPVVPVAGAVTRPAPQPGEPGATPILQRKR